MFKVTKKLDVVLLVLAFGFLFAKLFFSSSIANIDTVYASLDANWHDYATTHLWYPVLVMLLFSVCLYVSKSKYDSILGKLASSFAYGMLGSLLFILTFGNGSFKGMAISFVACFVIAYIFKRTTRLLSLFLLSYYAYIAVDLFVELSSVPTEGKFAFIFSQSPFFYLHDKMGYVPVFLVIYGFFALLFGRWEQERYERGLPMYQNVYGHRSNPDVDYFAAQSPDSEKDEKRRREQMVDMADNARSFGHDRATVDYYDREAGRSPLESHSQDNFYNYHPERKNDNNDDD